MRGRTLNRSFVVLDEAQNTTNEQMFMFLTRLGAESKCVVTGDPTQIDLPHNKRSGLIEALQALRGLEAIHFCHFGDRDVVRHELVRRSSTPIARIAERANPKTSVDFPRPLKQTATSSRMFGFFERQRLVKKLRRQ